MLETGRFDEALTRAVLYVGVMVRDQFFVLQLEPERAIEALPSLVPELEARMELLKQVRAIASAGDPLTVAERGRLARLSQTLGISIEKPPAPATLGRLTDARATARPEAELH